MWQGMKQVLSLIVLLAILPHPARAQADSGRDPGNVVRRLDDHFLRLQDSGFSGVIIVRTRDFLFGKGYGMAQRARSIPATTSTLFHIGSVTKQFTGAAILKLEMEGKLRVTDPISRYFGDVPRDKAGITIHHLLIHTAGIPTVLGDCGTDDTVSRDQFVRRALSAKLEFTPGERHSYSNAGYSLLGAIVEMASGQPYETYLRKHLFEPAGMFSTGYTFTGEDTNRVARAYREDREYRGVFNAWAGDGPVWCLRPGGGVLSTAEDMYRWYVALQGNAVLSQEAKAKLFASHVPEQPEQKSFYGYGWAIFTTTRGTKLIAHNGSLSRYFTADYRMYVDEGVFYFIAANTAKLNALDVSPQIPPLIFGPPAPDSVRTHDVRKRLSSF